MSWMRSVLPTLLRAGTTAFMLGCGSGDSPTPEDPQTTAGAGATGAAGVTSTSAGTPAAVSGGAGAAGKPVTAGSPAVGAAGSTGAAGATTSAAGATAPPPSAAGSSGSVTAGSGGASASAGTSGTAGAGGSTVTAPTERFSFFVTSLEAMRQLSKSENGFGGDLRYGQSTGLAGADKICSDIAELSMPGASAKGWHAFLSTKAGGANGGPVNARDRIGNGPWYDRAGRLIAMNLDALIGTRPQADSVVVNDLPNERGEPNRGDSDVDNHDTITGSNAEGRYADGVTCEDWTSVETPMTSTGSSGGGRPGRGGGHNGPMCGHSWPAMSGQSWIASHPAPGCSPSVSLVQNGAGSGTGIGNGGGYGGFYCFAMMP